MKEIAKRNEQKAPSERLAEVWPKLNKNQRRLVIASLDYPTKKEAAESIGIEPHTAYKWPSIVDEAIELIETQTQEAALGILIASIAKAAMVKVAGLDSIDDRISQSAAIEILDRNLGKPMQKSEITGKDGEAITIKVVYDD